MKGLSSLETLTATATRNRSLPPRAGAARAFCRAALLALVIGAAGCGRLVFVEPDGAPPDGAPSPPDAAGAADAGEPDAEAPLPDAGAGSGCTAARPCELVARWQTPMPTHSCGVAWGDLEGDGDLDLAFARGGMATAVLRNDAGELSRWTSPELVAADALAFGDVDGDGRADLALGRRGATNLVFRSTGTGFVELWEAESADETRAVALGDVDGDGDADLVVANGAGRPNALYRNDGGTRFVRVWTSTETEDSTSVALADRDGDGDADLLFGSLGAPLRIFDSGGGLPRLAWSSSGSLLATGVAWGDWEGDGDLDVAVSGVIDDLLLETLPGGETTTHVIPSPAGYTRAVAWADIDGDGDLDLSLGGGIGGAAVDPQLALVTTDGPELRLQWTSPQVAAVTGLAWGDLDGDGVAELAFATGHSTQLGLDGVLSPRVPPP